MLRRESVLRIVLEELTAELDLDIIGRLDGLSQSLSSTPDSRDSPTKTQVRVNQPRHNLDLSRVWGVISNAE